MGDLRVENGKVVYIDDNSTTLYTLPTEAGTENQVIVIDANGNLRFGDGVVGSTLGALSNVSDSVDSTGANTFLKYDGNQWIADSIVQGTTVAFSVRLSTNLANTDYTAGVIIPYDSVVFDIGSGWDSANYAYVIPVSGYYQLNSMTSVQNVEAATWSETRLVVNGDYVEGLHQNFSFRTLEDPQGGTYAQHVMAGINYFEANDSIKIEYILNGDTSTLVRYGARFNGFYIGTPSTAPNFSWNSISGKPNILDSTNVISIIDDNATDSSKVTSIINDVVTSTYVQDRQSTNATTLNNFSSSHFLNYNNLSNAPTNLSDFANDTKYLDSTTVTLFFGQEYIRQNQITYNTSDFTDSAYVQSQINAIEIPSTTDSLTEGNNLYYTTIRFDSDFGNNTTSDLTEGNNLYYTTARHDSDTLVQVDSAYIQARQLLVDSASVSSIILNDVDSAYIQARQLLVDSASVSNIILDDVDSAYVRLRQNNHNLTSSSDSTSLSTNLTIKDHTIISDNDGIKLNNDSGGSRATLYAAIPTYDGVSSLPLAHTAGEQAFVPSTGRLYISTGSGWYNIALINNTPLITSATSSTGDSLGSSYYSMGGDGQAFTVTILATDSDGDALTYDVSLDTAANNIISSVTQSSNVFTITPITQIAQEQNNYSGTGNLTFTVSDGINTANTAPLEFRIALALITDWSTWSVTQTFGPQEANSYWGQRMQITEEWAAIATRDHTNTNNARIGIVELRKYIPAQSVWQHKQLITGDDKVEWSRDGRVNNKANDTVFYGADLKLRKPDTSLQTYGTTLMSRIHYAKRMWDLSGSAQYTGALHVTHCFDSANSNTFVETSIEDSAGGFHPDVPRSCIQSFTNFGGSFNQHEDNFDLSGEYMAAGIQASGGKHIHIWRRDDSDETYWHWKNKITTDSAGIASGQPTDGWADQLLLMDQNTIVTSNHSESAGGNANVGQVYIYKIKDSGSSWELSQKLQPDTRANAYLGRNQSNTGHVDIRNNTLIMASYVNTSGDGNLYIYQRDSEDALFELFQTVNIDSIPGPGFKTHFTNIYLTADERNILIHDNYRPAVMSRTDKVSTFDSDLFWSFQDTEFDFPHQAYNTSNPTFNYMSRPDNNKFLLSNITYDGYGTDLGVVWSVEADLIDSY